MSAPLGNKFALGLENSGRSPIYGSPELMQEKINQYFNEGLTIKSVVIGKAPNQQLVEIPVPTITGLALYLGFESRQSLYDYQKKDEFSYIVKRARLFIESEYEEQLSIGNTTGAIFALKNMGWVDRTDLTTNGKEIVSNSIPQINVYQGQAPNFASSEDEIIE